MGESVACRLCGEALTRTFVDLGMSPPCESYLRADQLDSGETFYPLHVRICDNCLLVQLPAYVAADDVFSDYLYFSSYSTSWVEHARRFVVDMQERLDLGAESLVVEAASNDGYLLQHATALGIPVLGIEPAANIAEIANEKGIRTESYFLGERDRHGRGVPARPGGPCRRQQRVRARAGHRRLRQGPARAGRRTTAWCRWSSRTCSG